MISNLGDPMSLCHPVLYDPLVTGLLWRFILCTNQLEYNLWAWGRLQCSCSLLAHYCWLFLWLWSTWHAAGICTSVFHIVCVRGYRDIAWERKRGRKHARKHIFKYALIFNACNVCVLQIGRFGQNVHGCPDRPFIPFYFHVHQVRMIPKRLYTYIFMCTRTHCHTYAHYHFLVSCVYVCSTYVCI